MKTKNVKNTEIVEFSSMNEFYKYLCDTPFNESFRWESHASVDGDEYFTGSKSFEEAVELMKNGWKDMAQKLTHTIKMQDLQIDKNFKAKNYLDVCGYQAIVPLYLQGVPNNMVNKRMVPIKQKVVTINKCVQYSANVRKETIIEESIKALQIIKKIESQGVRCNLNVVVHTTKTNCKDYLLKIRIKNANEKMNVSKLAFPLVHPSMLRRLFFRFLEIYPDVEKGYVNSYGQPANVRNTKDLLKDEYVIPSIFSKDIEDVKTLQDIC